VSPQKLKKLAKKTVLEKKLIFFFSSRCARPFLLLGNSPLGAADGRFLWTAGSVCSCPRAVRVACVCCIGGLAVLLCGVGVSSARFFALRLPRGRPTGMGRGPCSNARLLSELHWLCLAVLAVRSASRYFVDRPSSAFDRCIFDREKWTCLPLATRSAQSLSSSLTRTRLTSHAPSSAALPGRLLSQAGSLAPVRSNRLFFYFLLFPSCPLWHLSVCSCVRVFWALLVCAFACGFSCPIALPRLWRAHRLPHGFSFVSVFFSPRFLLPTSAEPVNAATLYRHDDHLPELAQQPELDDPALADPFDDPVSPSGSSDSGLAHSPLVAASCSDDAVVTATPNAISTAPPAIPAAPRMRYVDPEFFIFPSKADAEPK
jgi:hypothetical protein